MLCSRGGLLCLPDQLHFVNTVLTARLQVIYTTNAIESLNSVIRHAIKKRKVFPIDESVKKVMRLAIQSASQKWTMPLQDWRIAMSRFIIEFGDCCGQLKLATALEFFQYRFSDSFGGNPPLYSCGLSAL